MNDGFGIESPGPHHAMPHREPVRYVVIIDSGGSAVARLFREDRTLVTEVDAAAEEIADMTRGLTPQQTARDATWDRPLSGHSATERASADIYTLTV